MNTQPKNEQPEVFLSRADIEAADQAYQLFLTIDWYSHSVTLDDVRQVWEQMKQHYRWSESIDNAVYTARTKNACHAPMFRSVTKGINFLVEKEMRRQRKILLDAEENQ